MKKIFFIAAFILLIFGGVAAHAGPNPPAPQPPGPQQPGPTGEQCDFTAVKNSLYGTESAGSGGCTAVGPTHPRYGRALGRYQFMSTTREQYMRQYPECAQAAVGGVNCNSDATFATTACCAVQECLMDRYLNVSLTMMRNSTSCQQLINSGQTFTGRGSRGQTLTCRASASGVLAAMHLGGNASDRICRCILANTCPPDSLGTNPTYYMCRHGNLPVPSQCTPPDPQDMPPPGTDLPPATWDQIIIIGPNFPIGPSNPLRDWVVGSLMLMAEQFTVNMMAQVQAIGMFLDAKHQLETQRLFQEKMAEAHRDYHPSEQMCTFGTFARDLGSTDRESDVTRLAFANEILQRDIGAGNSKGATAGSDSISRVSQFLRRFCNPQDNGSGLAMACIYNAPADMVNADINYTKTLDLPLSLEINPDDGEVSQHEETVFALIDNLFAHDPMPKLPTGSAEPLSAPAEALKVQHHYMNVRSIVAIRGIIRNSMANIVAMKTESPLTDDQTNAAYMRSLLVDLGLTPDEITEFLGTRPSYYAQMEFLTKKIYQNPTFYTNLYDKPANVKRIRAAMRAIKLMQERDIHDALLRREMLLSLMLELRLREQADKVYDATENALFSATSEGGAAGGENQGRGNGRPAAGP